MLGLVEYLILSTLTNLILLNNNGYVTQSHNHLITFYNNKTFIEQYHTNGGWHSIILLNNKIKYQYNMNPSCSVHAVSLPYNNNALCHWTWNISLTTHAWKQWNLCGDNNWSSCYGRMGGTGFVTGYWGMQSKVRE